MPDSPLKQLLKDRPAPEAAAELPPVSPSVVGNPNPFLLDFALLNGNHIALPYSSLLMVHFNPSGSLVLLFATHTVHVTGIYLRSIYEGLVVRAVGTLIAVGDRPKNQPENVPIIFIIEVTQRTGVLAEDERVPTT